MKHICEVEDCGEEISEERGKHGGLPICDKCRGTQYYWRKQGRAAIQARRGRLSFWQRRIDYLEPHIERMIERAKQRVAAARPKSKKKEARAMH